MKKNIIIGLALGITLSLAGCSDFLEPHPKGKFTEENYFKTEQDAINAVQGIYGKVLDEYFSGNDDTKYEGCSDDILATSDHYDIDPQILRFTVTPGNSGLANRQWPVKYEVISRANLVIMNVPNMSRDQISEAIQNRSVGEAYFFRAFAHWWLYLVHGEIPVINEEDVKNNNYNKPKNTIDEVLGQIEADLLKAVELLPATTPAAEGGRVHKGSAWSHLAQLYMHWSCYPGKDAYLDKVIEAGSHIIGNSDYKMVADFSDCFRLRNGQINTEVLFQLNGDNGAKYNNDLEKGYFWELDGWDGWCWYWPTQNLVDAFGNDPRLKKTIVSDGDVVTTFDGGSKVFEAERSPTGYASVKNAQYILADADGNFACDKSAVFAMMRTSDVYLLVAEAKIRKSGTGAGDTEINAVRHRVGATERTGYTAADLVLERRLELAAENRRFFDLRRWDRCNHFGGVNITTLLSGEYNGEVRTFQAPKHYFFPIPQEQIDRTNGVLIQNSEY
ncbi:membrane protein [Bacteroidia bacterium]|nr:membrane protein [Bacteroidia bacterium]